MIRVYSEKNINKASVTELWQECFGDSAEYISFFLNNCPEYTCICYLNDNNHPVSMLFLIDGYLNGQDCKYLYAACTSAQYRRQGIMEQLISFAKGFAFDAGSSGIFLVPANEKLYSYYSKFGFIASFKKKQVIISTIECNNAQVSREYCYSDLVSLKKELSSEFESFIFNDMIIEYTIKEHLFNGGDIYFNSDTKTLAFYYETENKIIVKEILSVSANIKDAINEVFVNNKGKNIYILCPVVYNNTDIVEEYAKCGMCFPLNEKMKTYLENNREVYAGMYLD